MSKYLVLKSSNSPENKSYNRFAPPSAQAFQEDAFQSFHKSPREKGWLSRISADLLEELDTLLSSRKDGAHLREVIVRVGDSGEKWGRALRCLYSRAASPLPPEHLSSSLPLKSRLDSGLGFSRYRLIPTSAL